MPSLSSRGRGGRSRRLVNEINVVPYIDVMLVLLVIFMVTAPLLPPGSIDLPTAGKSQQKSEAYIEARLEKTGRIALMTINAGEPVRAEATEREFVAKVRQLGAGAAMPVVISADKDRPYGDVVRLLSLLQTENIRAALMVKPGK
jgi:biopolymer transport protein TolR